MSTKASREDIATEPHAVQRRLAALGLAGKPPPPGAVTAR